MFINVLGERKGTKRTREGSRRLNGNEMSFNFIHKTINGTTIKIAFVSSFIDRLFDLLWPSCFLEKKADDTNTHTFRRVVCSSAIFALHINIVFDFLVRFYVVFFYRYKDDRPYPWPTGTVSGLIIYPQSANQTVYTHEVVPEDAGNYTCLLKNDTVVYSHTIHLRIYSKLLNLFPS